MLQEWSSTVGSAEENGECGPALVFLGVAIWSIRSKVVCCCPAVGSYCLSNVLWFRLVHAFTCADVLPRQYIKLSRFADIGVVGKWFISRGKWLCLKWMFLIGYFVSFSIQQARVLVCGERSCRGVNENGCRWGDGQRGCWRGMYIIICVIDRHNYANQFLVFDSFPKPFDCFLLVKLNFLFYN